MLYRTHMKFALQAPTSANLVQACSPTEIRVGERVIRTSLILTATEMVLEWPPQSVAELSAQHLQSALELAPEVILLGTGARQIFPDAQVLAAVQRAGDRNRGDGYARRLPDLQCPGSGGTQASPRR